jgi:hypothetical protein
MSSRTEIASAGAAHGAGGVRFVLVTRSTRRTASDLGISDVVPASRLPELPAHIALGAFVFGGCEDLARQAVLDQLSVEHEHR